MLKFNPVKDTGSGKPVPLTSHMNPIKQHITNFVNLMCIIHTAIHTATTWKTVVSILYRSRVLGAYKDNYCKEGL